MPTAAEEAEMADVLVSAVREQRLSPHPELAPGGGGGFYFFDGTSIFQIEARNSWSDAMKAIFGKWAEDDDGDGVSNFFDELHGFDDGLPKIKDQTGAYLAEVAPGIYAYFTPEGDRFGYYYKLSDHATSHTGTAGGAFQLGENGASITVNSGTGMQFDLIRTADPFGH